MNRSWREVVAELAGPDAEMSESTTDPEWDDMVVAQLSSNAGWYRIPGQTADEAWARLAHELGDTRLIQALEAAGWTAVEEVIDETTYVVARAPDGTVWGIGVAASDSDRRGYLETDMRRDNRAERIAFVEPLDTRDAATLLAALEAAH